MSMNVVVVCGLSLSCVAGDEVTVSERCGTCEESAKDRSHHVDFEETIGVLLSEDVVGEDMLGNSNGRVETTTGVGSKNVNHGGKGVCDNRAGQPWVSSVDVGGHLLVLDDDHGEHENKGRGSLHEASLPVVAGPGEEMGEHSFSFANGERVIESVPVHDSHAEKTSQSLCKDGVGKVENRDAGDLPVEPDSDRDGGVHVTSTDGSGEQEEEEKGEADSEGISVGGVD